MLRRSARAEIRIMFGKVSAELVCVYSEQVSVAQVEGPLEAGGTPVSLHATLCETEA
jgi:hypothetical protein